MNTLLHPVIVLSLTSLPLAIVCLDPVSVQFEKSPVLVASGKDAVFTVQTVADVSLIRWTDSAANTLAMWVNGVPVVMPVQQYLGRISVTATQFTIAKSQIRDSGNYTVSVEPSSTTGFGVNTRSVQLKVFDAVSGVSLSLPSLPLEGGNVSLSCSWSAGTEVSVVWGKAGAPLSSDSHISVSARSLLISTARRDDAGEYTCTVSNAVSAQTAKASLNIYYGPDVPQLTKSSSECVGGGDATVGQTVLLTCTSASLPPASFTWQINGQPVSSSQSGSGVLSLQIFSANQSGRYVCTAQNDITGGTSKQQIDLAIVGTCLSGGAVAGIVVACVVALIIIIAVIIVLLRQRNVDRRLRDTVELQKTNQNEGITIANRAVVNENHPDPTLNHSLPQNFTAIPDNNNGNIGTMAPNVSRNPLHHNGHLNADEFRHRFSAVPDNGHQNNNSHPNNNPQIWFPQQTPNIPNSQPRALAPTVHVNLNTLPRTDQFSTQPQTVHVNLNTYPPEPQQAAWQHADQRESQQTNANFSQTGLLNSNQPNNLIQTGYSHSSNQTSANRQPANQRNHSQTALLNSEPVRLGNQTQTMPNSDSTNGSRQTNSLIHTGHSHPTNQTNANHRTANSRSSRERQTRHSNNQFNSTNTHLQQIPWDRLRGTPAYPNREVDNSDSSDSSDWRPRSPQRDERRSQRRREVYPQVRSTQAAASSPHRRDLQRPPNHLQLTQVQSQIPRHALPQTETSQGQNPIPIGQPRGMTIPQAHPQAERTIEVSAQPFVPLTEAALRQHTVQTDNTFTNRIHQTQAALRNTGPSQPIQQINKAGQRVPTPPPVLRPEEFQSLPRKQVQQARRIRHRSPNAHRQTQMRHTSPQRMPGMHHVHGHPTHMQQVHRGRPRR